MDKLKLAKHVPWGGGFSPLPMPLCWVLTLLVFVFGLLHIIDTHLMANQHASINLGICDLPLICFQCFHTIGIMDTRYIHIYKVLLFLHWCLFFFFLMNQQWHMLVISPTASTPCCSTASTQCWAIGVKFGKFWKWIWTKLDIFIGSIQTINIKRMYTVTTITHIVQ